MASRGRRLVRRGAVNTLWCVAVRVASQPAAGAFAPLEPPPVREVELRREISVIVRHRDQGGMAGYRS